MGNSTQQTDANGGTPLAEPTGSDDEWVECWNCGGDGYADHDCGEDCCCCADPEPNVVCHVCHGKGGWSNPNTVLTRAALERNIREGIYPDVPCGEEEREGRSRFSYT